MENRRMRKLYSELSDRQKRRRIVACLENSNSDTDSSVESNNSMSPKRVRKTCSEMNITTENSNSSLSIRNSEDYKDKSRSSQLPQLNVLTRTAEKVISQPNQCHCKEVMELNKKLERKVDKLTKIMLKNDEASQKPLVSSVPVMPPAANNLEELKILANHPHLVTMDKKFLGIFFSDNTWQIVPKTWVFYSNGLQKVYWPTSGNVATLAESEVLPDKKKWASFSFDRVAARSNNYQHAEKQILSGDATLNESGKEIPRLEDIQRKRRTLAADPAVHRTTHEVILRRSPRTKVGTGVRGESDSSEEMEPKGCSVPVVATEEFSSNQSSLQSLDNCRASEQKDTVEKKLAKLEDIMLEMKSMIQELQQQKAVPSPIMYQNWMPASTEEELQNLLKQEDLVVRLKAAKEVNLTRTVSSMLKLLLSRQLALTFSMTGLGARRLQSKTKFNESPACKIIEHCLSEIPDFSAEPRSTVKAAIRNALKGAVDWDGHRGRRRTELASVTKNVTLLPQGNQEPAGATPSSPRERYAYVMPAHISQGSQMIPSLDFTPNYTSL